jgi:hypothetical protein
MTTRFRRVVAEDFVNEIDGVRVTVPKIHPVHLRAGARAFAQIDAIAHIPQGAEWCAVRHCNFCPAFRIGRASARAVAP